MKHFLLLLVIVPCLLFGQDNFKSFKLDNGLTVVLDKDATQKEIFGVLAVNAGSKDEKLDATGVAHYLEHMLFKGTEELGTANWVAEKPHYENIIKLYDELEKATTEEEGKAIYKKINKASQEQSKHVITNEFTKLVQQMGGVGLNATTSFDVTRYFNSFPPNQLEKWLDLYSHRLQKPVFRLFQTELETVYEEKNRAEDSPMNGFSNAMLKAMYGDHPYARPIIGKTEHLKKPSMTKMIAFYDKWYVPANMVLVLSGNFDLDEASKLIKKTFGQLEKKPKPIKTKIAIRNFKGKEKVKVKLTPYMRAAKIYNGPKDGHSKEGLALQMTSELLSNSASIGLLDKLSLDGSVMFAGASFQALRDGSNFSIHYAPVFDSNQGRQNSFSSVEKLIDIRLKVLLSGNFNHADLEQVKGNMLKDLDLEMESSNSKAFAMVDYFINDKDPKDFLKLRNEIKAITKKDIMNVVNKYLNDNYLLFYSSKGEADKEKVVKPEIQPIKPLDHDASKYAKKFYNITAADVPYKYINFATDVKRGKLQENVNLFYVENKRNNVFSMELIFNTGLLENPKLEYAVALMNNSGVASQMKPNELKQAFGKLGVDYSFGVSNNYTTVNLSGREESLADACKLLSKLMIMPEIEDKALNRILGNIYYSRSIEKKKQSSQYSALTQYIKYGDKSSYLDRVPFEEVKKIRTSEIATEFAKALAYKVDIHYYGKKSVEDAANILNLNLAFVANRKAGTPPQRKKEVTYKENTVYIVNNSKVSQSKVFFYIPSNTVPLRQRPIVDAFNQYFSGGFNGLVMQEIREFRSLAYSAGARYGKPTLPSWKSSLTGSIGTQTDKTNEAVETFISLLNNMPQKEKNMASIKDYLINSSYLAKPSDRYLSHAITGWELNGYRKDPQITNIPYYKAIKFKNVVDFYNKNIKGKPYVIGIVGSINKLDLKELEKLGKVIRIKPSKLFSKK